MVPYSGCETCIFWRTKSSTPGAQLAQPQRHCATFVHSESGNSGASVDVNGTVSYEMRVLEGSAALPRERRDGSTKRILFMSSILPAGHRISHS